jgi:nucleoside-diphosphate-sugar epimerase
VRQLLDELVRAARAPVMVREESPADRRTDVAVQVGDPSRLAGLGWRAEIPFEESVVDLLESWRNSQTV